MAISKRQLAMAAVVLIVISLLRLPSFWTPILDVDESQFAGFANALTNGGLPFLASVDTKPLGIYYFFAAIFSAFGRNNMLAIHLITAIWVWITAIYCLRIGRIVYSERAGWFAALFYAVFTTTYVPKFISTSIIVILMLPLTMSIYHIIAWERDRRYHHLILSGLLFGVASLFKYQAGINLFLVAFYFLLFAPLYLRSGPARPKAKPLLIFLLSGSAIGFMFYLYLKSAGVWDAFIFWSIKGSAAYISAGMITSNFMKGIFIRGGSFAASSFLIWFFGIREMLSLSHRLYSRNRRKKGPESYLILFWFLISIVPVCTGGRFFGHYFIQLLPSLCILAGGSASRMLRKSKENARRTRRIYALLLIGILIPATGFFIARLYSDEIYAAIGEDNPNEYRPLGEYIKARTKSDDTIFVWGFATPVYFYADRPAASRFLWCDWLTGRIAGSPTAKDDSFDTSGFVTPRSWGMFFDDIEKNKPVYIVDTSVGNYHDYGKYPINLYPRLVDYLNRHYRLETRYRGADFYRRVTPD